MVCELLPLLAWVPKSHCVEVGSVLVLAGVSPPRTVTTEAAGAEAAATVVEEGVNRFLLKWTFSFRLPVARLPPLVLADDCDRHDGAVVGVPVLPLPIDLRLGVTTVSEAECCCRISFWAAGEPVTARRKADPSLSLDRDRPDERAPKFGCCCCCCCISILRPNARPFPREIGTASSSA